MCLLLEHLEPKIADKDIVCYKIVEKTKIKGIYKSCVQEFEYIIEKLYTNNISIEFSNRVIKHFKCVDIPYIEENMFHSYINRPNSIQLSHNEVLLKCIIPKEAYYYIGVCGSSLSYASSQIKILEEI